MNDYKEREPVEVVEQEHLQMSRSMAGEMINRFDPLQQNEMIRNIRSILTDDRHSRIDKATKEVEYIKSTLQEL